MFLRCILNDIQEEMTRLTAEAVPHLLLPPKDERDDTWAMQTIKETGEEAATALFHETTDWLRTEAAYQHLIKTAAVAIMGATRDLMRLHPGEMFSVAGVEDAAQDTTPNTGDTGINPEPPDIEDRQKTAPYESEAADRSADAAEEKAKGPAPLPALSWDDHVEAENYLDTRGYKFDKGLIYPPYTGTTIPADERSAMDYLIGEFDYAEATEAQRKIEETQKAHQGKNQKKGKGRAQGRTR